MEYEYEGKLKVISNHCMDLYTQLSTKEYLEDLRTRTTEGNPTMGAGPWVILRVLTSMNDKNPFYGKITSTGFELIKNFKLIPIVVGIQGELHEEGERTRISTKIEYLIFPVLSYFITFGALIAISLVTYLQTNDLTALTIEIVFGLLMAFTLTLIYRYQIRQIRNLLIEKTSTIRH